MAGGSLNLGEIIASNREDSVIGLSFHCFRFLSYILFLVLLKQTEHLLMLQKVSQKSLLDFTLNILVLHSLDSSC